jgi:integrase
MSSGSIKQRLDSKGEAYFVPILPRRLSIPPEGYQGDRDEYRETLDVGTTLRSKAEAARVLAICCHERERGRSMPTRVTVQDAYNLWLKDQEQTLTQARGSLQSARHRLRSERSFGKVHGPLAPFWEAPWAGVTLAQVEDYVAILKNETAGKTGEPLSGSHIRACVSKLRTMFDFIGLKPNPCIGLKLPKKDRHVITYLSLKEQRKLLSCEAIPLEDRVRMGCLITSGLRIGEFLAIEREHVFLEEDPPYLHVSLGGIHGAPLKARSRGEYRVVYLPSPADEFWQMYVSTFYEKEGRKTGQAGRLFSGAYGGYDKHWADRLKVFGQAAGVVVHAHKLRHTYAMSVINCFWGGSLVKNVMPFVQKQLGHSSVETTERHVFDRRSGHDRVRVERTDTRAETENFGPRASG